jgi:hypothetical protein
LNSHIPYEYTQSELSKILKPIKKKFQLSPKKSSQLTAQNSKHSPKKVPTIVFDNEGFLKSDNKKEKLGGKIKLLQKIKLNPQNLSLDTKTIDYLSQISNRSAHQGSIHSRTREQLFKIKRKLQNPPLLKQDDFVGLTGVYGGQYQEAKQHKISKKYGL